MMRIMVCHRVEPVHAGHTVDTADLVQDVYTGPYRFVGEVAR
jgi:hypothetical protein